MTPPKRPVPAACQGPQQGDPPPRHPAPPAKLRPQVAASGGAGRAGGESARVEDVCLPHALGRLREAPRLCQPLGRQWAQPCARVYFWTLKFEFRVVSRRYKIVSLIFFRLF